MSQSGDKPDDEDEARARVTASLATLAQAMPALLEQFRALACVNVATDGKLVDVAEEQRLAALVRFVKLLAKPDDAPLEALALEPLVETMLAVTRADLSRRARLMKFYAPAPLVLATEAQLGQLLLELFLHTARALAPVDEGASPERILTLRVGTSDDGWAALELEPTGGFATATTGKALDRARALVERLGGRLRAAAALRVELPPAQKPETSIRA